MPDPKQRRNIRCGRSVVIVLKQDQDTGYLTDGVVRDILTNVPRTRTASRCA
jgi:uncharacterized repeat protein (TIGR03833 family)